MQYIYIVFVLGSKKFKVQFNLTPIFGMFDNIIEKFKQIKFYLKYKIDIYLKYKIDIKSGHCKIEIIYTVIYINIPTSMHS